MGAKRHTTPSPRSAYEPSTDFETTMMSAIRDCLADTEPQLFPEHGAEQHPTSPPPSVSLKRHAVWMGPPPPESSRAPVLAPLPPAEAEIAVEPPPAPKRSRTVLAWAAVCFGIGLAVAGSGAYAVTRSVAAVEEVAVEAPIAQAEAQPQSMPAAAAPAARPETASVVCQPSSNNRAWGACAKSHAR